MWYTQENWAQKSCLYHCSIKTGVFPDVVFSRLLNLKDFRTYSPAICRAASASPATVHRARENYVCCTHSNLRIYKLVKLNVCLPPLQPWSYLPVCVYLRVQHRTDLVFHGAGWRWGDADSLHDLLHLLEHLSCPVDNLGCSSRHKILIRVHPICSLGYLHIPSAPAEGFVMYRQITCDGPGWVLAVAIPVSCPG